MLCSYAQKNLHYAREAFYYAYPKFYYAHYAPQLVVILDVTTKPQPLIYVNSSCSHGNHDIYMFVFFSLQQF